MTSQKLITVLGATGSIGLSTLDVVARHSSRFGVFALSAQRRIEELAGLCNRHRPRYAVVPDDAAASRIRPLLATGNRVEVLVGPQALEDVAAHPDVGMVMAAIVGAAGLRPSLAAAQAGKRVLLANKESLVCAGDLFMAECRRHGATLLPIDSEHNAVFQCLTPMAENMRVPAVPTGVTKVILTASGGPFRRFTLAQMRDATAEQACAHPNWSMGRKISVDSASMMNKGLELIEAHYLFGLPAQQLEVIVHPQSIIHSMVEYADGSVLAQLGNPDMRTPIAQALAYPERVDSGVASLSLAQVGRLDFETPDLERFPCLSLALGALRLGGGAACVLNAANEVAVEGFLAGRLRFTQIAELNARVLEQLGAAAAPTELESVMALDAQARLKAHEYLRGFTR